MSNLTDEELTKLAVESLMADARKFNERHERSASSHQRDASGNLNTGFLRRLINNNESHNQRMEVNRGMGNPQVSGSSSNSSGSNYNDNRTESASRKRPLRRSSSSSSSNTSRNNGRKYRKQSSSSSSSSETSDSDSSSCHSTSVSFTISSDDEYFNRKRLGDDILDGVRPKKKRKLSSSSTD